MRQSYNRTMTSWKTKLMHSATQIPKGFLSLVSPNWKGSTVLFPGTAALSDDWD